MGLKIKDVNASKQVSQQLLLNVLATLTPTIILCLEALPTLARWTGVGGLGIVQNTRQYSGGSPSRYCCAIPIKICSLCRRQGRTGSKRSNPRIAPVVRLKTCQWPLVTILIYFEEQMETPFKFCFWGFQGGSWGNRGGRAPPDPPVFHTLGLGY